MKKLVTAACALAAGMVLADVESSNIVGVQEFTPRSSFELTGPTFVTVGTDGSGLALSNITVNSSWKVGNDYILIYEDGTKQFNAAYLTEAQASVYRNRGYENAKAGWWNRDSITKQPFDFSDANYKNSYVIPYGTAIGLNRSTSSAKLIYSGEVVLSNVTPPAPYGLNLVPNTLPVDIALSNITVNASWKVGNDYILIYEDGIKQFNAAYLTEAQAATYRSRGYPNAKAGWWNRDSITKQPLDFSDANFKNSYVIPAGVAFGFNRASAAARLIINNPIEIE